MTISVWDRPRSLLLFWESDFSAAPDDLQVGHVDRSVRVAPCQKSAFGTEGTKIRAAGYDVFSKSQ